MSVEDTIETNWVDPIREPRVVLGIKIHDYQYVGDAQLGPATTMTGGFLDRLFFPTQYDGVTVRLALGARLAGYSNVQILSSTVDRKRDLSIRALYFET